MRKMILAGALLALVAIPAVASVDLSRGDPMVAAADYSARAVPAGAVSCSGDMTAAANRCALMSVAPYASIAADNLVAPAPLATVAAEVPVDTIVSIPWGDWLYDGATTLIAIIGALMAWGIRHLPARLVAVLQTDAVEQLLKNAISFGVNTTAGAAKGKSLSVDVGNEVLEKALQYAIDNAPKWLISWAGGAEGLKGKIIARLDVDANAALLPPSP